MIKQIIAFMLSLHSTESGIMFQEKCVTNRRAKNAALLHPSINNLAEKGRPREDRERNGEVVGVGERVINKSLISWAFSPPSSHWAAGTTYTRSRIHLQPPAGLVVLYRLLLGGDWFVASVLRLSYMMTAVIQPNIKGRRKILAHQQLQSSWILS